MRLIFKTLLLTTVLVFCFGAIAFAEAEIPQCDVPVAMTAPGQSPEYAFVKIMMNRVGVEVKSDPMLAVDELTGNKTLIIIIGGSGKGLGAAGIDIEEEVARAKGLIEKAKAENITLVGMHLGGEARLGANSMRFIELVSPEMDFLVVRSDGNKDGLFSKIAESNNIPLSLIDKTPDLSGVLDAMFN